MKESNKKRLENKIPDLIFTGSVDCGEYVEVLASPSWQTS